MITIPSRDLCGILGDVLPFTTSDDLPRLHSIRIHWDGTALHAQATDMYRIAWSTWSPDDPADGDEQADLLTELGGADDPWSIVVDASDAKDVVTCFKLPAKEAAAPLTVTASSGRLTIDRDRDTGHPALTTVLDAIPADLGVWPDVEKTLAGHTTVEPVRGVAYTGRLLADFTTRVRQTGPVELTFTDKITLVGIGKRFQGAIVPTSITEQ